MRHIYRRLIGATCLFARLRKRLFLPSAIGTLLYSRIRNYNLAEKLRKKILQCAPGQTWYIAEKCSIRDRTGPGKLTGMTKNLSLKERHIFNIVESDDQRVATRTLKAR
jgi:hypothetical protein